MPTSSRLACWGFDSRSSERAPVLRTCVLWRFIGAWRPKGRSARRRKRLEARHRVQLGEALLDLLAAERGDPLGAEPLDVEGGEHGAVAHRPAQTGLVELALLAVEVADEAAGEAVASAGRVAHVLERAAR